MGWTPGEARLEQLREQIGEDPAAAAEGIRAEIATTTSPSHKTRLHGLLIAALRRCDRRSMAWRAYEIGTALRAAPLARAELEAQAASLALWGDEEPDRGAQHLEAAQRALDQVTSTGTSRSAKRRRQAARTLQAAILTIRGQLAVVAGDGRAAIAAGLAALAEVRSNPLADRSRLAAVTVIGRAVPKSGTPDELADALVALLDEEAALLRRRPRTSRSLALAQVRWCRALIVARFGSTRQAERLLLSVVDDLDRIGARQERDRAVDSLLWVIGERQAEPGRALYLARRLNAERTPKPA